MRNASPPDARQARPLTPERIARLIERARGDGTLAELCERLDIAPRTLRLYKAAGGNAGVPYVVRYALEAIAGANARAHNPRIDGHGRDRVQAVRRHRVR
jgi:hypothetical protein